MLDMQPQLYKKQFLGAAIYFQVSILLEKKRDLMHIIKGGQELL
jgi:hypothetical protein